MQGEAVWFAQTVASSTLTTEISTAVITTSCILRTSSHAIDSTASSDATTQSC